MIPAACCPACAMELEIAVYNWKTKPPSPCVNCSRETTWRMSPPPLPPLPMHFTNPPPFGWRGK